MSDIVERLRAEAALTEVPKIRTHQMMDEAADELERLRARVEEVEYWNGAVAVCADHVQDIVALGPKLCVICDEVRLRAEIEKLRDALRKIRGLYADSRGSVQAGFGAFGEADEIAARALSEEPTP